MIRRRKSLDQVKIAHPCPASWDEMTGTERVRFCAECELHVYNISGMTREEAETLIRQNEGRICLRLYRRKDGTVLTRDCPVGLRAVRRKIAVLVGMAAATLLYIFSQAAHDRDKERDQRNKNRAYTSVLDWFDPVPKWEPVDTGPNPYPYTLGW